MLTERLIAKFEQMKILVTFRTMNGQRTLLEICFDKDAEIIFMEDYPADMRGNLLSDTDIILSWNPEQEGLFSAGITSERVKFIQLLSAGYDHINLESFPKEIKIAANQGAYASPMAEHAAAMMLALSKRLFVYHNQLAEEKFNQLKSFTKSVNNAVLGIIGFGSIGKATSRLMNPFGVRILALNTTGKTDEEVEFIGTLKDLDYVLKNCDILLIACPLNDETNGLINKHKLEIMKDDAVLINVARGQILDEQDLYEHLKSHPNFYAGIDAWWVEPFKYGKFVINYPFFELPNLLGSPHNSAMVDDAILKGTEKAAKNVIRFINNEKIVGLIN